MGAKVQFIARPVRATGDYILLRNGYEFGRLANCEVCHVFVSDDEELTQWVAGKLEGGMTLREMLAAIRQTVTSLDEYYTQLAKAEQAAEGAWLRAAEYDAEAQADLDRVSEFYH